MEQIIKGLKTIFNQKFSSEPLIVRSPGRINLIGEHTDYNDGFVLPAAIDKAVYVAISETGNDTINLHSVYFNDDYSTTIQDLKIPEKHWAKYIIGVAAQFQKIGLLQKGFNLVVDGDLPFGAGISSSAALECATAFAINELFGFGLDKMELVHMAQKAEHEYAGVMCGIMDQFASMFGRENSVVRLDCRSMAYTYEPFAFSNVAVVLMDTMVKHSLASGEYNQRQQQCEQGVAWVRQKYPDVKNLRDVSLPMLEECVKPKDELIYNRCSYVVEEIDRLLAACTDLKNEDLDAFGQKMYATHDGLSRKYAVSCDELDFLVEEARRLTYVKGARMMGGGFGGCTINILEADKQQEFIDTLSRNYKNKFGIEPTAIPVQIKGGTQVVS